MDLLMGENEVLMGSPTRRERGVWSCWRELVLRENWELVSEEQGELEDTPVKQKEKLCAVSPLSRLLTSNGDNGGLGGDISRSPL